MEEVQSWWEVPTIAHFCYVFRAAFNLLYIEIAELEAAILSMQDPEMCVSLEQLVTRILQGCYDDDGEVTSENWEEKLQDLFKENYDDKENPLNDCPFPFLTPRCKVEALLRLCECRLDVGKDLDAIKDIPAEAMQAKCVGKDSKNNTYWYFCDERLYKEDLSVATGKSKKRDSQGNTKNSKNSTVKNGKRTAKDKKTNSNENITWSVACHNVNDWETLMKKFSKSKQAVEKELAKEIKDKYLPILAEVVAEKDRQLRKRFLELQPKRTSSRISKLQAQQKLEEQMAAEAAAARQKEQEEEEAKRESRKKQEEIDGRRKRAEEIELKRKRAEEREKKIQERSSRAKQRERARLDMISEYEEYETSEEDDEAEDKSAESSASDDDECENESSPKENSSKSESDDESSEEESENNVSSNIYSRPSRTTNSVSHREIPQRNFARSNIIRKSYDVTNWNSEVDSKGHKIHILRCSNDELPNKKMENSNKISNYQIGENKRIPANEYKSSYYKDNNRYHPFRQRNLNSCTKERASSSVIRIDFIKPAANHKVSS